MPARQRNLGGTRTSGTRERNLAPQRQSTSTRERNLGQGTSTGPHASVHGIGGFFHNLEQGATSAATGALPGLYNAGEAAYENVRHPLRGQNWSLNPRHKGTPSPFEKRIANPILQQYKSKYYDPLKHGDFGKLGSNIYADPFGTGLDALTLLTLGAGGVARGGEILGNAGVIGDESRLARLASTEGKEITLRSAAAQAGQDASKVHLKDVSKNPLIRARQHAIDKALKRLPVEGEKLGGIGRFTSENARYGRAVQRQTYHEARRVRVLGYPFEKAWHRLSKTEKVAWSYHSDALHPTEEAAYLKTQHPDWETNPDHELVAAAIKRGEDPKVIAEFEHPSKKLQDAIDEGRALSERLKDERLGGIEDSTLHVPFEERPFLHLRLTRGAGFQELPAEGGRLSRARMAVTKTQKAFDRASERVSKAQEKMIAREADKYLAPEMGGKPLAKGPERVRPRAVEEARARFDEIDRQYQAFVDGMAAKIGHPHIPDSEIKGEQLRRNMNNAKFDRQQSGKTRSGRASGSSGAKVGRRKPLVSKEIRDNAERVIDDMIAKHPENPTFKRVGELLAERDNLQELIGKHMEESIAASPEPVDFGSVVVPPKERVRAKPGKGEASTPEDFAATKLGNKVLTHDNRLLTPRGGALLEGRGANLSAAKTELERAEAAALARHGHVPAPGDRKQTVLWGGPTIDELRAEGRNPFYVPDVVKGKAPSDHPRGLGGGVPMPEQALKRNLGRVFTAGALYRNPEALHVGHLRFVRSTLAHSIHDTLLENGVKVGQHESIPAGWTYVRADAREKISHLTVKKGDALEDLKDMHTPVDFVSVNRDEALLEDGFYTVVPKAFAGKLTGEFTRSDNAFKALWEKPTKVWRALVLGLRPGFFTNNVVGNYLLYGLRHNGWASVEAWLSFLRETHQEKALDELGQDVTFRTLAMHHIPEAFTGTFARTQFEDLPGIGKLGRFRQGVGPVTARVAEEHPRLMIARETVIKEAQSLGRSIPKQTKDFNELADEMFQRPGVAKRAVDEANRTLGDYLQFTKTEEAIRGIIPFYSWVRAITRIALRTTADTPGRALLISQLGQLAIKENESKYGPLPYYLQGMIGLSKVKDGQVTAISTRGLNPASTVSDVIRGVHGLALGKPGEGAQAISDIGPHPFLQALYEWASGKSMGTGATVHPALLPGLAGYTLGSIGANLPQLRLAETLAGHSRKSKIYANNGSRLGALAAIAGVPVKRVNLPAANLSARLPNRR